MFRDGRYVRGRGFGGWCRLRVQRIIEENTAPRLGERIGSALRWTAAPVTGEYLSVLDVARARRDPLFYIVDGDLKLLTVPERVARRPGGDALPREIDEAARRVLRRDARPGDSMVVALTETTVLRIVPLDGVAYGLFIETLEVRDPMRGVGQRYRFTARETEILAALVRGESTSRIGATLYITAFTVQQHVKNIGRKMGLSTRKEIVAEIVRAH